MIDVDFEWPEPVDGAGLAPFPDAYQMSWATNTYFGEWIETPPMRLWHTSRFRKGRIRQLEPGMEYCVRARLRNKVGWGEYSEYAVVKVPEHVAAGVPVGELAANAPPAIAPAAGSGAGGDGDDGSSAGTGGHHRRKRSVPGAVGRKASPTGAAIALVDLRAPVAAEAAPLAQDE